MTMIIDPNVPEMWAEHFFFTGVHHMYCVRNLHKEDI
jgi:hypothetical protein